MLTDSEGNAVIVYQLKVSDGRVNLHEVTKSCVYETPIASFDLGKYVTLSLEYFSNNETVMLYIDGELSAISNIIYDSEFYSKEITGATLSHVSGAMIKIDNMFLECVNKLFLLSKIDSENKEDGAEIITFEHSSGGNLPSSVSVSLNSGGASVRIKELIERDKALILVTNSGGADTVSIKSSNTSGATEAMVLSTRIRMDIAGNLYLFFYSDSGKQLHRININVDSLSAGGGVRIDDNSGLGESYGYGTLGNPLSGKTVGEWFDLKIEFVNYDDGNMEARIFVDGKYFATSKEAAWAKNKALDISRIDMTTSGGSTGSFAIGEISLAAGLLTDIPE